ncbi:hypothetical protein [Desertibacillus haloalkaliphilus]|nr:hypothetical protein [Desertibacillus haloalkaliphilus]
MKSIVKNVFLALEDFFIASFEHEYEQIIQTTESIHSEEHS